MIKPTAFKATYSDWKLIKTRGVVQVVMEVPLAEADAAYDVLGGMPNPSNETWFGIAPIRTGPQPTQPPAGAKRDWRDLRPAQQAGIRCEDPIFRAFLKEMHPKDWRELDGDAASIVRSFCGVVSRSEIGTLHATRALWHQLDEQFQTWKALEHA